MPSWEAHNSGNKRQVSDFWLTSAWLSWAETGQPNGPDVLSALRSELKPLLSFLWRSRRKGWKKAGVDGWVGAGTLQPV